MKICVLGAGVIGVSTALALALDGHEVHVIDQANDVASGASAANGAQLSYSYVDPFASPATLRQLPAYLSGLDPAVHLGFSLTPAYLSWCLKFVRECAPGRTKANLLARVNLALRSQDGLQIFEKECGGDLLTPTGRGKIVLAESQAKLHHMKIAALEKSALGIKTKVLSKEACVAIEPALVNWQGEWAGGLYAAKDCALDPVKYCKALKKVAHQNYGVQFHFGQTVQSVEIIGDTISAIKTDNDLHSCDIAVICLGPKTNNILQHLDMSVPIYPFQGYSLTLAASPNAPTASITDLKHKIVFSNLGNMIRVAGFMDVNQSPQKAQKRGRQLHALARKLWPDIANYDADPQHWTQYRPMIPSGIPIIKQSKIGGLYLNVGHGSLGYTFAAGSAMLIAQMMAQHNSLHQPCTERNTYA